MPEGKRINLKTASSGHFRAAVYERWIAHNNLLFLFVALFFYWRYSEFAYSQGGAKFPTGGKSADAESPRALQAARSEGQQTRCNSGADG